MDNSKRGRTRADDKATHNLQPGHGHGLTATSRGTQYAIEGPAVPASETLLPPARQSPASCIAQCSPHHHAYIY